MLIVKNGKARKFILDSLEVICWMPAVKKSSSKTIFLYGNSIFVEHPSIDDLPLANLLISKGFRLQLFKNGDPYILSEEESSKIRENLEAQTDPIFSIDSEIKIIDGLFKGCKGKVREILQDNKLKVGLDVQSSSFTVILSLDQIESW